MMFDAPSRGTYAQCLQTTAQRRGFGVALAQAIENKREKFPNFVIEKTE
jgi:hypothetical protein